VVDYVKAQRLSMEWFGQDIEVLRRREIGARSKRHRLDALEEYLAELQDCFTALHRVVRSGGYVAIVFGESRAHFGHREHSDRSIVNT